MIKIANTQFWVHDQDEALRFYTKVLGWEVRADVTMQEWNFRWLAVGPTVQPYGIDTSFRDPSGNNIRLTQVLEFDPARGTTP